MVDQSKKGDKIQPTIVSRTRTRAFLKVVATIASLLLPSLTSAEGEQAVSSFDEPMSLLARSQNLRRAGTSLSPSQIAMLTEAEETFATARDCVDPDQIENGTEPPNLAWERFKSTAEIDVCLFLVGSTLTDQSALKLWLEGEGFEFDRESSVEILDNDRVEPATRLQFHLPLLVHEPPQNPFEASSRISMNADLARRLRLSIYVQGNQILSVKSHFQFL